MYSYTCTMVVKTNRSNQELHLNCEVVDSQPIGLWKAYQMCIKKYEIKDKYVASVHSFNMTKNSPQCNHYAYLITYGSSAPFHTTHGVITIEKGGTRNEVLIDLKRIIKIFPSEWIIHWSLEANQL